MTDGLRFIEYFNVLFYYNINSTINNSNQFFKMTSLILIYRKLKVEKLLIKYNNQ